MEIVLEVPDKDAARVLELIKGIKHVKVKSPKPAAAAPPADSLLAQELREAGQEILVDAHLEPWGQTTARLLSPEGLLVGISYLPEYHSEREITD